MDTKIQNKLNLSHSNLSKIPEYVKGMKILKNLDLSRNKITLLDAKILNLLHLLEILDLSGNFSIKISYEILLILTKLKKLDLSYDRIPTFPLGFFNGLSLLEILDLSSNKIEVIKSEMFVKLTKLKELNLSNNHITNFHPEALNNLH